METKPNLITVNGLPIVVANFNWSVGVLMEKFLKALAQKKFLASKCPSCGYTYAPARNRCGKCATKMEEKDLLEIPGKGTLVSYCLANVELDGKGSFSDLKTPKMIAAVNLDGANSTLFMPLEEIDPKNLKIGMKVELAWNAETKGGWKDIKYLKPAKA